MSILFEPTEFTEMILSLNTKVSTLEELYLKVISDPSIAMTFV